MRYAIFIGLGLLFALTGFQIAYSRMTQAQRWQALCFTHIAMASDCADRGYRRL